MSPISEIRREQLVVYIAILLTGFTFLIYEISWNRMLSLVLGTTVAASTIVLASFMAGLGVGAYYWGNKASRRTHTVILPVLLGGIGFVGAINYFLIADALPHIYAAFSGSMAADAVVFAVATGLLFVQAFLMGGIFPIICKIAIRSDDGIASSLGHLYALETLGSTVGGLAAGFIFLGMLGQKNTVGLAVIVNVALAVWMLTMGKLRRAEEAPAVVPASTAAMPEDAARKRRYDRQTTPVTFRQIALVSAFVCGFVMLSLQVLWIRMFRVYLTNTSYTFTLVASLVILGLFAGSILFKGRRHRISNSPRSMLRVLLFMGALAGLGLLLLIFLPEILMFPFQTVLSDPFARVLLLPLVASLLIVFPPAVLSGYAFPLACHMYTLGNQTISRDVGLVLMINTMGCVIGPIVTTFLLLPVLGAAASVLVLLAGLTGTALYILQRSNPLHATRAAVTILYVVTAGLLVVIVLRPEIRILPPSFSRSNIDVLFYRESVEGTLSVARDRGNRSGSTSTYVNNSAVIGSTYDAIKAVKMVGHYPFLLGGERKKVLVIGFGIGVTTSAIASHPEVESIECVELVAGLRDAAVFYRDLNQNVVDDPRLKIISGDGRHYLQQTSNTYDLISCDPTHPILGSGSLYTKDYFELCRKHLNPGGVVSQYLPLHKLRTEEFMGIISTFYSVFPNCAVWLGNIHAVLLGSINPIQIDFEQWSARVARFGQDPNFYSEPYHLAATMVLDGPTIARLGSRSKILTDDHSYTEFFVPACLDEANLTKNLRYLMDNRAEIGAVFSNINDPEKMAKFVQGNQLLTESLFYQLNGDKQRGLQSLREACRVNPEDQEFPFLIRLNY
jgi:spermidine synthase